MKKVIYVGLDVHKESIVVGTAPEGDTTVELYGQIGGTLDALDFWNGLNRRLAMSSTQAPADGHVRPV